ncbi:MAG TPA: isochorismatase family protein [Phycisphaerae bacterium]|nr:isochorismatase family protein [Phycisphaerae bacterium]
MNSPMRRSSFDRILVDMNTQCDFLLPNGAVPVANRSQILPNIRKLMNWGRIGELPVVSSLECHRPGESLNGLPSHCVDRSGGQRKLPFTLMARRIIIHADNTLDLPLDPFRRYQQLIFTKRNVDFLANPKADRLVNSIFVGHVVVFGVLAEQCVKAVVLGLLTRQIKTVVVTDACGYWCAAEADLALRQMEAKGAILVTTEELLSGAADAKVRAPRFDPALEIEKMTLWVPANGNGNGKTRPGAELGVPQDHEKAADGPANGKHLNPLDGVVRAHITGKRLRGAVRVPKSHPDLS